MHPWYEYSYFPRFRTCVFLHTLLFVGPLVIRIHSLSNFLLPDSCTTYVYHYLNTKVSFFVFSCPDCSYSRTPCTLCQPISCVPSTRNATKTLSGWPFCSTEMKPGTSGIQSLIDAYWTAMFDRSIGPSGVLSLRGTRPARYLLGCNAV